MHSENWVEMLHLFYKFRSNLSLIFTINNLAVNFVHTRTSSLCACMFVCVCVHT